MKVAFLCSSKEREQVLAEAFGAGIDGDMEIVSLSPTATTDADVVCMVGVKCVKHFKRMRKQGRNVIFLDKGYLRHRKPKARTWEYWRIALNTHHPTEYVATARHTPKRWDDAIRRLDVEVKPWRSSGEHIVYAGSSAKYHEFCGIEDPTTLAQKVVDDLKKITDRPIIYRPKPSWEGAVPVEGAGFSSYTESIGDVLQNAWCVVTHGSNACFESILAGIPVVVLGEAIAKPISSQLLSDVNNPLLASRDAVDQWFSNLAWCQFTEPEMESGMAWRAIRRQLR